MLATTATPPLSAPSTRLWPTLSAGLFVVFGMLGGMIAWAHLTRISGAIVSPGFIAVETKVKTIQHLEGGVVAKIFVRDADRVQAGDLLLQLDSTELRAQLESTQAQLLEALGVRARLEAERTGGAQIQFSSELSGGSGDPAIARVRATQEFVFNSRRANRVGQRDVLTSKIQQINRDNEGNAKQLAAKTKQRETLESDLANLQGLIQSGLVTRTRISQLERDILVQSGEEGRLEGDIAKNKAAIDEFKLQILQIDKAFDEQISADYKDVQPRLVELGERLSALKFKLQLVEIRAPISGQIHNLSVVTVGGVVAPGKDILQIVPDRDRLVVEGKIAPADIAQVKTGNHAFVKLSAFEATKTPQLNGVVGVISPAQNVDPSSRAIYFNVTVEVSDTELKRLVNGQVLKPGMPTEIFITTTDRSALEYLMKPVWDQMDRGFRER
jgi:HlyD family secretion protein